MVDGVLYFSVPNHAYAVDARTGQDGVALLLEERSQRHRQPRRGHVRRLALFRDARQPRRVARRRHGRRTLAQADRQCPPAVLLDAGARRHPQPRHRRHGRRCARRAGVAGVARSGDRRDPVEVVHDAETRRARHRDVAQRTDGGERRGHAVAAAHLRSRAEPALRAHRQPQPGARRPAAARRQPLHRVDRRARRGYRQDGVAFPGLAARHPRLGRHAGAGALRRRDRREAAQAAGAGESQRLLLRPRPDQRPAASCRSRSSRPRTGSRASTRRASRFRRPTRSRRFRACWCRRAPTARPTIRRPASIPTPGSSTSTPPNRGASTI